MISPIERLIEHKALLMKSRHSNKDIDKAFQKRATIPRRETLKNKTKFITEYEP